ncbi:hypothetical protein GOARA_063_00930 [Gordonia araii NBRC 100433]|uniref:ESAT-6-like protein n=1 Tax=Gordonia araii NBRC 100433 TaxID=1073574 RepID=G7H4W9_9ACTN|nr:hypothetical protein [Gordonia araii]NNG97964.1 hypothetical protein [Gordonia araii NBRC 100433]GAB10894.1 hypothetical protein GOARA_063_00930 [Gordonia araii NBRC 100433]
MAPGPFQISADEVGKIVRTLADESTNVQHISYSGFGEAKGDASAVAAALKSLEQPAARATTSIAMRMDNMSTSLEKFNAQTVESDGASAAAFDRLKPR